MNNLLKKHIWMVYTRPSADEREQMKQSGITGVDEWLPALKRPVWCQRAMWLARDKQNKFTETKVEHIV